MGLRLKENEKVDVNKKRVEYCVIVAPPFGSIVKIKTSVIQTLYIRNAVHYGKVHFYFFSLIMATVQKSKCALRVAYISKGKSFKVATSCD